MNRILQTVLGATALCTLSTVVSAESLTIATVNNGDMIRMQKLTNDFTSKNPGIKLKWVTLEENVLRQKVTTDIATNGGQFDVMTIGTYEAPLWAKQGWLVSLDNLGAEYDHDDLLPSVVEALSYNGTMYAAPFYGESSLVMYRTDLFKKAGLKMPSAPSWEFIGKAARKLTDRGNSVSGICLRGKPGWGENMALVNTLVRSYGGSWFEEDFTPRLNQPVWEEAVSFYVSLLRDAGPKGATSNGFNENLALFQQGKCAMWIDASVAASFVSNPRDSIVASKVGYALSPDKAGNGKRGNWLWSWALAIPGGSNKIDSAKKFIAWATSKGYTELVASKEGWANVPPGTRKSLYANANYQKVPFAAMTLDAMNSVKDNPPHESALFPVIAEYQGIGTRVGQLLAAAVAGDTTVTKALNEAQSYTLREVTKAGHKK